MAWLSAIARCQATQVTSCNLASLTPRGGRGLALIAAASLFGLAFAGGAQACACANEPIEDRLARADAAVVGQIAGPADGRAGGGSRLLRVDVEQRVKGDVPSDLVIRAPFGTDCDLPERTNKSVGLLLTKDTDGMLLGNLCSTASAGELVVAGGEPRGGPIKVVIGFAVLALVLLWSFRRLKRGSRPDLPGAPRP